MDKKCRSTHDGYPKNHSNGSERDHNGELHMLRQMIGSLDYPLIHSWESLFFPLVTRRPQILRMAEEYQINDTFETVHVGYCLHSHHVDSHGFTTNTRIHMYEWA